MNQQTIRKLLAAVFFALPAGLFAADADIDGLDSDTSVIPFT